MIYTSLLVFAFSANAAGELYGNDYNYNFNDKAEHKALNLTKLAQNKTYNKNSKTRLILGSRKKSSKKTNSTVNIIDGTSENVLFDLYNSLNNNYGDHDITLSKEVIGALLKDSFDQNYKEITVDKFIYNKNENTTPLNAEKPLKLLLLGDFMARGVNLALRKLFIYDRNVKFINYTTNKNTLYNKKSGFISRFISKTKIPKFDAVIFMAGNSDYKNYRKSLSNNEDSKLEDEFLAKISEEFDNFVRFISKMNKIAYVIGLPITFNHEVNLFHAKLNKIIMEKIKTSDSITYIDSWDLFANEEGDFEDIGYDIRGIETILRTTNGISFTKDGYLKLAEYIEEIIRADFYIPPIDETEIEEIANIDIDKNFNIVNDDEISGNEAQEKLIIYEVTSNVKSEKIIKNTYHNFHQFGISTTSESGRADDFIIE